jgi:hypothetical protein
MKFGRAPTTKTILPTPALDASRGFTQSILGELALPTAATEDPEVVTEPVERAERRTPPLALLLVPVVAAIVFAIAHPNGSYGLDDRATLALEVWFAVGLGVLLGILPLERFPRLAVIAGCALAALAGLTLLSAAWSVSAEQPVVEFERVLLFIGVLTLVVLATRVCDLAYWSHGLALGISAVAALSLAARFLPKQVPGDHPLTFLAGVQTRLAYPLGYWTALGVLVGIGVPLVLHAAVALRRPLLRGAAVFPLPALAAVLYLTSARLGAGVAALGVVVYFGLSHRRFAVAGALLAGALGATGAITVLHARPPLVSGPLGTATARLDGRQATVLVILTCIAAGGLYWGLTALRLATPRVPRTAARVAMAVVVVVALAAVVLAHPVRRFDHFRATPPGFATESGGQHLLNASSNGRWQLWSAAVAEFRAHPVLGGGAGSFEAWYARHGSLYAYARDGHSLFLEQLGELGVLGLLLVLGTFATGVVAAARALRMRTGPDREVVAALVAAFVAYVVAAATDWMWEMTVVTVVGIVLLGLLLRGAAVAGAPAAPRPMLLRAATAAGALVAILVAATLLLGSKDVERSQAAAGAGDLTRARSAAHSATRLEPWAATPFLQVALVDEARGDPRSAQVWIDRALRHDRTDWRLWLVQARIERSLGLASRARASLAQARTLNPRSSLLGTAG